MGKVLYFLVFMALIAQIYTVPAAALGDADAAIKGAEDQVKQGEDKAMKTEESAVPEVEAVIEPAFIFGKKELSEAETAVSGLMGIPSVGVPAKN